MVRVTVLAVILLVALSCSEAFKVGRKHRAHKKSDTKALKGAGKHHHHHHPHKNVKSVKAASPHHAHKKAGKKILFGTPVDIKEAPFVARIVDADGDLLCGAVIIGKKYLLTAAQCHQLGIGVVVGSDNLYFGDVLEIENFIKHPEYCDNDVGNDIAIVELANDLTFGPKVQPIEIADSDFEIDEDAVFDTFGFGETEHEGVSEWLLKTDIPKYAEDDCAEIYQDDNVEISDAMICAGGGDEDTCSGDSGGPLIYEDRLVGITSFGQGCGDGIPGVYTRVSAFIDFINDNVEAQ